MNSVRRRGVVVAPPKRIQHRCLLTRSVIKVQVLRQSPSLFNDHQYSLGGFVTQFDMINVSFSNDFASRTIMSWGSKLYFAWNLNRSVWNLRWKCKRWNLSDSNIELSLFICFIEMRTHTRFRWQRQTSFRSMCTSSDFHILWKENTTNIIITNQLRYDAVVAFYSWKSTLRHRIEHRWLSSNLW